MEAEIRVVQAMNWRLIPCDRLTTLPFELLIGILSLLPTKDAAATSVLSRKLRRVFPFITALDFDVSPIDHCLKHPYTIERYPSFVRFVDTVLQTYKSNYLSRFRLQVCNQDFWKVYFPSFDHLEGCKEDCLPDLNLAHLNAWISFPLSLCGSLRELDLCILVRKPGDAQLPPAIFTCETLEVLKLQVNLGLDQVIAMPSYRLPNLKLLFLCASVISDDDFLPRLVSSCPLLEDLTFKPFARSVRHTTIVSTSLRRICLAMGSVAASGNPELVLIDTPNLEYLKYFDNLAYRYSIPLMHRLVEANLSIREVLEYEPSELTTQKILGLIRFFSHVQHLSLSYNFMQEFDYAGEKVLKDQLPVFPNLRLLELDCADHYNNWDKLMTSLLNCTPVLETLIFARGVSDFFDAYDYQYGKKPLEWEQKFFRTAHAIPSCCRYHLKRIVVKKYYDLEREVEKIQFLLRHALVLEELVICPTQGNISHPLPDRVSVKNTLNNLPKASVTCSIQVL